MGKVAAAWQDLCLEKFATKLLLSGIRYDLRYVTVRGTTFTTQYLEEDWRRWTEVP